MANKTTDIWGIDVSRWQKGFNLQNALNEGFTYIIIKAGGGDKGYYKDALFDTFYAQAKQLNFAQIGSYYFGCAFSIADALKEANCFIQYLQGTDIKKVYYDVEGKMLNQSQVDLTNIIKAFCDAMNAAGYDCGIYSSEHYFNHGMVDAQLSDYPHWVAKYSKNQPKLTSGIQCEIWQYGGSKNFIRDPKIAGTTVDQNFVFIPWDSVKKEKTAKIVPVKVTDENKETIKKLAEETLAGKYGIGEARKKALGPYYDAVQAEVNALIKAKAAKPVEKTTEQLANEVLAGLHGNGIARRVSLGSRYAEVQALVDKMVKERTASKTFTYTIVKGDTLLKVAKKYNTTVKKLCEVNNIENPNKIWVGQMIIIS